MSRELAELKASSVSNRTVGPLHVLALDSSSHQTSGAQRRQEKSSRRRKTKTNLSDQNHEDAGQPNRQIIPDRASNTESRNDNGSLTHYTLYVGSAADNSPKTKDPLEEAIDHWVSDTADGSGVDAPATSTPVLFVALHACGSLTPSILQSALKNG